jgi:hypothetical protein
MAAFGYFGPPSPNGSGDRQQQPVHVKENLKKRSTWLRVFFMFVITAVPLTLSGLFATCCMNTIIQTILTRRT